MSNCGGINAHGGFKDLIRDEALRLGFSHCGFARNDSLEEFRPYYSGLIRRKGYAGLDYLESNFEKRMHPELVLEGTRSVVALLMNYYPPEIIPENDNFVISKYAYGPDYHKDMRKRVDELAGFMTRSCGDVRAKAFVDSGAVLEKAWAQKCGVGWQGKNTLIINRSAGSFFFIGIILTGLELEPDLPETDHCGNCSKCMTACPTGALSTPYQLDIPRCLAYLTIESGEEMPGDLKTKVNDRIYGCDICQDACPYNRFAKPHPGSLFRAPEEMMKMRKDDWLTLTESDFENLFSVSPVKRIGYQKLMSNIRMAASYSDPQE
jgi:epoxyqueuosine reductase